jgi:hypothetical protein
VVQMRSNQRRPASLRLPCVIFRSITTKRIACFSSETVNRYHWLERCRIARSTTENLAARVRAREQTATQSWRTARPKKGPAGEPVGPRR